MTYPNRFFVHHHEEFVSLRKKLRYVQGVYFCASVLIRYGLKSALQKNSEVRKEQNVIQVKILV